VTIRQPQSTRLPHPQVRAAIFLSAPLSQFEIVLERTQLGVRLKVYDVSQQDQATDFIGTNPCARSTRCLARLLD
jgi:hypothetical protein